MEGEDTASSSAVSFELTKESSSTIKNTPHKRSIKLRPLTTATKQPRIGHKRIGHKRCNLPPDAVVHQKTSCFKATVIVLCILGGGYVCGLQLWEMVSPYIPNERIQFYEEQISTFINDNLDETCAHAFNGSAFLVDLRKQVLHQEEAQLALQHIIRSHNDTSAVSIVGGSGTGKTLAVTLLLQHFQWPNNVLHLIWAPGWRSEDILGRTLHRLGKCGHNLIVIDSIPVSEQDQVAVFHRELIGALAEGRVRAFIVYVFNIPTFLEEQLTQLDTTTERVVAANNLTGIQSVLFRPISLNGVRMCVKRYGERSVITGLSDDQIEEIVRSIDPERSGCKHVHAQISIHL